MLPDLGQQGLRRDGLLADEVASGGAEERWTARSSTPQSVWETVEQFGASKRRKARDCAARLNPTARRRGERKLRKRIHLWLDCFRVRLARFCFKYLVVEANCEVQTFSV